MVDIIAAVLMAIFQGIIEWLPISSEGQLTLLFVHVYGMQELEAVTLAVLLHIGTMLSVLWVFRADFLQMIHFKDENSLKISKLLLITTLGTALTAIPLIILFKAYWIIITENLLIPTDLLFTAIIGLLLILTGLVLSKQPDQGTRELTSITSKEALLVGMVQGIAVLPGISRSGTTLTLLLILGLTQRDALRTSFIISVPAVFGATVFEFLLSGFSVQTHSLIVGSVVFPYWLLVLTIVLCAFIGLLTMNALLRLKDVPFDRFCVGFGIATIMAAVLILSVNIIW
ncbi:MAG: undecaprenyl-diphosphate phosphatase [Candidatus Hodarchaeota archaeon]